MRKGSERFPAKHHQVINGRPLYVWTLEHAIVWAKGQDDAVVMVSTDDMDIFKACVNHPSWVIARRRDPKLSDPFTPKLAAIRDCLEFAESDQNRKFDLVLDLDVTNPMRKLSHIDGAIDVYRSLTPTMPVVSVTRFHRSPYFNMLEPVGHFFDGQPVAMMARTALHEFTRSQDVAMTYDMNACIYVYPREFVLNRKYTSPVEKHVGYYVMPPETFIDVDEPYHLVAVEALMRRFNYA